MGGTVSTPQTDKFPLDTTESNDSLLRPSKLLLNVSIENTLGAIQVLMLPEDTVGQLVKVALMTYDKEKRRPLLKDTDPNRYQLHYSPFTLESLKVSEKLKNLGSRNFFLCSKPSSI
ncbi:hypothetical protein MtrunA17_Chr5g0398651 [Medicago truncatula]|uniref:DUF7054 domain-containing protein n=1 Tax=Medicago truncatula TaxID=3880 RepID=G7KG64_MEDTR|nr:uncharacterized protein LOC11443115 [Medicago truncatula]AES94192.1 hypothetical protein MTR_5g011750 [Medicago truncatula]RHN53698.1 hypothetical protein MtrunA17_Chr5g0398651 [Medicago truncatula]